MLFLPQLQVIAWGQGVGRELNLMRLPFHQQRERGVQKLRVWVKHRFYSLNMAGREDTGEKDRWTIDLGVVEGLLESGC